MSVQCSSLPTSRTPLRVILITIRARGVDYPGVTKVIQVGAPQNRDIYIHRIGRTGRAGASGDSIMILAPFEKDFISLLHDIPIKNHDLPASELEVGPKEQKIFDVAQKVVPEGMVEETYTSLLGFSTYPRQNTQLMESFTQNQTTSR
jgi:ATP-dependent RNA helicase MSS116, mitochondrial